MNVLLIEDEKKAALRLTSILKKIDSTINIIEVLTSVKDSIDWFKNKEEPDILFLDIQLSDGSSFEIFKSIDIHIPIIFITAFNKYAIDAFKLNSIDYILKPYTEKDIKFALKKFEKFEKVKFDAQIYKKLSYDLEPNYKQRFFTRINRKIFSIHSKDILYFAFEDNATILIDINYKTFVINYSLDKLEELINPKLFFRINRNKIININSIAKMNILSKSRIEVCLLNNKKEMVSRSKTISFKKWLDY